MTLLTHLPAKHGKLRELHVGQEKVREIRKSQGNVVCLM